MIAFLKLQLHFLFRFHRQITGEADKGLLVIWCHDCHPTYLELAKNAWQQKRADGGKA